MSQQRADKAGIDVIRLMLFHCVCRIYHFVNRRRTTVKNFHQQKINPISGYQNRPVVAENIKDNLLLNK